MGRLGGPEEPRIEHPEQEPAKQGCISQPALGAGPDEGKADPCHHAAKFRCSEERSPRRLLAGQLLEAGLGAGIPAFKEPQGDCQDGEQGAGQRGYEQEPRDVVEHLDQLPTSPIADCQRSVSSL